MEKLIMSVPSWFRSLARTLDFGPEPSRRLRRQADRPRPTGRTRLTLELLESRTLLSLTGAIFTTTSTGTAVNANIYNLKDDVYLNGGPQNNADPGLPTGTYYFQVTDPSGSTLLSSDPVVNRQVTVGLINGKGVIVSASTHATGFNPKTGATTAKLSPYH